MSLWNKFKEELGKGYDQVNILDGGKSYKTRTSSGPVGMDRIRDVFDANSKTDIAKRTASGQKADYFEQQNDLGNKRPYQNVGALIGGNTARFLNSAAAAIVVTPETLRGTMADLTHNADALDASLKRQKIINEVAFDPHGGLLGQGTIYDDAKDFETATPLETVKKVGLNTAGTALEIIPFAKGAGVGGTALYKGLSKPAQVGVRTALGATEGAAQDVIEQQFTYDKWRPEQTAGAAVLGGTIPNVTPTAGKLIKSGKDKIVKLLGKGGEEVVDSASKPLTIKVADGLQLEDSSKTVKVKDTPSVYQTVNPTTGEKTFKVIKPEDFEQAKVDVDGKIAGTRKADGTVPHLTAKSPEEMIQRGFTPDGVYDPKIDSKLEVKPTQTGTVKVGQTQSVGELMPDFNARRAQNINPAEDIAARYGGKVEDVQRNIDRYGADATNNMYARKSDALPFNPDTGQGIKNIDAVVTSELKKQYPEKATIKVADAPPSRIMSPEEEQALFASAPYDPTVKVTQPDVQPTLKVEQPKANPTVKVDNDTIDTVTGEVLQPNVKPAGNIDQFIKDLPDPTVTSRADADRLIGEGSDWLRRGAETIDQTLQKEGDSYENFSRAIHQANIDGVEPPKKYADLYNQFVKPALDKYRDASGRVVGQDIGDVNNYYMPRMKAGEEGAQVIRGNSLVNSIDVEDFGSAASRRTDEFALGVDDIDHTPNALGRYGTQTMSERYRHSMAAADVMDQAEARGVKMTQKEASDVVTQQDQLAKEITEAAHNGGIVNSGMEKMDLVDRISKLGEAKGKEKFVLEKGLSKVKRLISGSDELYDIPYGGSGKTVGEVMGFERFTEARGQGVRLEQEVFDNGLNPTEHLTERYSQVPIDEKVKASIIERTQKRLNRIDELAGQVDQDGNYRFTDEQILERRQEAYMAAEKNIAREQTVEFLENTEIQDKQLRKNINQDAKRIIVQDKANQSFAHNLVNGFTGLKHVGLLGYSVMSAMFNGIETKRIFSKYGAKEYANAMKNAITDANITDRYGIIETKVGDILQENGKIPSPKWWKPMGFFQKSEGFKDAALLHAAEAHYKAKGLQGEELFRAVYNDFNKYGIKYGQIGSLGYNKSKTGRLLGQFMQYPIKDWTIRVNEAVKAFGGKNATALEKKEAQRYLMRDIPATAAVYLGLSAALGVGWEQVVGINNPMQANPLPKDAEWDEKIINKLPGGPFVQDTKDLYLAIREAYRTKEEGETVGLGDIINNELKKDAASYIPGGQQILNRTGGFIADQVRGYDENSKGRARYEASDDPINIIKGVLFGGYTTDNAREYYGNKGVAGDLPGMGGETMRPVNQRYQDQINAGKDPGEIIGKSREAQARASKFYDTPQGKAWEGLYATTYNPVTKKNETDVISPEKWKGVEADKSGKTYTQLKDAANQRNRDFGDPVDPIYSDKWGKYNKEILAMRSQYTGDDTEMKDIANATKPWYKEYMKDYIDYINKMKNTTYTEDADYGTSQRSKDYYDLTVKNPSIPDNTKAAYPRISEYYGIKNGDEAKGIKGDPDKAKQFFKDHADELSANFKQQKVDQWNWTNQMRAIEGAPPIDWQTFQNVTFGYEDDERKVAQELYYKLKGSGGSGGGSYIRVAGGDFGQGTAAPTPTVSKPKGATIKVAKRKPTKIKMVRNKA